MFDFIKRQDKNTPGETKHSASARVAAWGTTGRVGWSSRDTVSLTRSGFTTNPIGFRSVKLIAEAAAALPYILQDNATRYETHPILSLLSRPNDGQGRSEFLEAAFAQLLLTGNAYIEAAYGASEHLAELYVLRSDRMRVVMGSDGISRHYEFSVNGKTHLFGGGDGAAPICHLRSFHPHDDHYGLSPMQAAATAMDVHNAASRWSKALLDNAARPSGAIVYRGPDGDASSMNEDQYRRLVDEMESQHQGAKNAGRPMLLEGGLDWKPMGFSPSDMEFQKTKEAAAREIATAFGVPPMMLGIPGDATYANYQEANRAFYRLTVLPLAERVLRSLANWLGDHTGESFDLRPDLDQVAALSTEREAQWQRIGAAEFLTDQEKRALLGLPAREVGNE